MKLLLVGTLPYPDFSMTYGEVKLDGDFLNVNGQRFSRTQGTGAMITAALMVTNYLKLSPPHVLVAGDTGEGKGTREIFSYLVSKMSELSPDYLVLHYCLPIMSLVRLICQSIDASKRDVFLIADAGGMYAAKAAKVASRFDIFTPDPSEMAFLADPEATHPAYVSKHLFAQDLSKAFPMIRSTVQWTKAIGYSGLIILFDEAEQKPSMSGKQKNTLLSNLVDVINESGRGSLNNSMFFYAVPSLNFLEGKTGIYEALNQRLNTVFDTNNPSGVKIKLEDIPGDKEETLKQIGKKLANIFEVDYSIQFSDSGILEKSIANIAKVAADLQRTELGYRRVFVQKMIRGLEILRVNPNEIISPEKAKGL